MFEAIEESLKLVPFLFVTFVAMELLEYKAGAKTRQFVQKAGASGPLIGSLLGVFPQCGFSAAASSLYAGRIVTLGTLIAIYLSTSDEMLPILISEAVDASVIFKILATKVIIGMVTGFAIDLVLRFVITKQTETIDVQGVCEDENCNCGHNHNIFLSALVHTMKIFVFIAIISVVLHVVIEHGAESTLESILVDTPLVGECLAALVGLIPNCAGSVVVTKLYLEGIIGAGAMMSGLLVSAGVGVLILFKVNTRNMKQNLGVLGLLYALGVFWGLIIELLNITF